MGVGAAGCGCWRLEFGSFAANSICIHIQTDLELIAIT